jgi:hypothetical protein
MLISNVARTCLVARGRSAVQVQFDRVYDAAGNVIETHEHKGDFKEP